jgi:hypothetical protein
MPDENYQITPRLGESPASISKPGNLLDATLAGLPPDQQAKILAKVAEKRVELDHSEKSADLRHRASTAGMVQTVQTVRALEASSKSDYTVKADFETASGRTSVEVKKNNNTMIIVVAVVIAVIFLVIFSRR